MTKKLTMAAWTAIFFGSVAVAETPPTEAPEVTVEEEVIVEAEAPAETIEASVETEADSTASSEPVEGEESAGGEMTEADEATIDAPEAD